jgi:hypothetical protein
VTLPEGTEMVMPGDNMKFEVELIAPIAMEEGCASPSAKAAAPSAPASSVRRAAQWSFGCRLEDRATSRSRSALLLIPVSRCQARASTNSTSIPG